MTFGFVAGRGLLTGDADGLAHDAAMTSRAVRQKRVATILHLELEVMANDREIDRL